MSIFANLFGMTQTAINFRMDNDLRQRFTRVVQGMGLTPSAAFTVFAKAVVREGAIPFRVVSDDDAQWEAWFYSSENQARLTESRARWEVGERIEFTADQWEEMVRRLRAEPDADMDKLRKEIRDEPPHQL